MAEPSAPVLLDGHQLLDGPHELLRVERLGGEGKGRDNTRGTGGGGGSADWRGPSRRFSHARG